MKLLTTELRSILPKLYSRDGNKNPIVYAKFSFPAGVWTWFVTEGEDNGNDFIFFGYVVGHEREWGYFTLRELESINLHGITIERDISFESEPFLNAWEAFVKQSGE